MTSTIWIGTIPNYQGYGISVAEATEDLCRKALKKHYYDWRKTINASALHNTDTMTFDERLEYHGGFIKEITLGKYYYDEFKE